MGARALEAGFVDIMHPTADEDEVGGADDTFEDAVQWEGKRVDSRQKDMVESEAMVESGGG